jgi:hypothetical protein
MTGAVRALLGAWLVLLPITARGQEVGSPHHMTKADGSLDMQTCKVCHNDDMSLSCSKLETCTLCHAPASHAGSNEHLRVNPAAVKRALEGRPKEAPALPLADDGHIYCGTCHLFHDPKVLSEDWLREGWLPPDRGLPAAVRHDVTERWSALAARAGAQSPIGTFATEGTRQLRLPVNDGQLCRQCHGALR